MAQVGVVGGMPWGGSFPLQEEATRPSSTFFLHLPLPRPLCQSGCHLIHYVGGSRQLQVGG